MSLDDMKGNAKLLFEYQTATWLMEDDEHGSFIPDRISQFLLETCGYNESWFPTSERIEIMVDLLEFIDNLDKERVLKQTRDGE